MRCHIYNARSARGQRVWIPLDKGTGPFNIGDRVRVTAARGEYEGRIGTVAGAYHLLASLDSRYDSYRYVVSFVEDGADVVFYGFELDTATPTVRKSDR